MFAQSSSPDFIRVKETLSGIHTRMHSDDMDNEGDDINNNDGGDDDGEGDEGGDGDDNDDVKSALKDVKENGIVRVYQLGLKSQRSFGRICGPRLRTFEGTN